jgi:hypothetical protein
MVTGRAIGTSPDGRLAIAGLVAFLQRGLPTGILIGRPKSALIPQADQWGAGSAAPPERRWFAEQSSEGLIC